MVNGQFYEPRFGSDTLQTMLTDEAFSDSSELNALREEIDRLENEVCSECPALEADLAEAESKIEQLEAQIRELNLRVPKP